MDTPALEFFDYTLYHFTTRLGAGTRRTRASLCAAVTFGNARLLPSMSILLTKDKASRQRFNTKGCRQVL